MTDKIETTLKEKIALYGNLATSGGSVLLLVTALNVLGQHGEEFNLVRHDIAMLRDVGKDNQTESALSLAKIQTKLLLFEKRISHTEMLIKDPRARPDSFTRTDFLNEKRELIDAMKMWSRANFQEVKD